MLVPGVHGNRKQGAGAPLETRLAVLVVPDGCRATTLEDVDHLLVERVLRRGLARGRQLEQVTVV